MQNEKLKKFMKGDNLEAWEKLLEDTKINEFIQEISNMSFKSFSQLKQIRLGLENGLKIEQVKLYANPEFYAPRMEEIRVGLEHGLSDESIQLNRWNK